MPSETSPAAPLARPTYVSLLVGWGAGSSSLWLLFNYFDSTSPRAQNPAWFPVAWVSFTNSGGTGNLSRC
jgi:hypothetical protein